VALYRAVEGELDWTDVDYWARTLKLTCPSRLAAPPDPRAPRQPGLSHFLRERKIPVHLVTNAHPKTLAIKMPRPALGRTSTRHHCIRCRLPQIQGGLLGQVGVILGIRSCRHALCGRR